MPESCCRRRAIPAFHFGDVEFELLACLNCSFEGPREVSL